MKVNTKRALYKRYRLQGLSGIAAAVKAGYSPNTGKSGRLEKIVGDDIQRAMEKVGLTNHYIAEKIMEGTQATNKNGEPDHYIIHKYVETTMKARGQLQPDKSQTNIDKMQVNVYLPSPTIPSIENK